MSTETNTQLEREIEEIRDRLAGTIDQLVYRTQPKTIVNRQVAATKARFVSPATGEVNTQAVIKAAAIATAALVGFVLLRKLARR